MKNQPTNPAAAPSIAEKQRWTRCKDKLPTHLGTKLVWLYSMSEISLQTADDITVRNSDMWMPAVNPPEPPSIGGE